MRIGPLFVAASLLALLVGCTGGTTAERSTGGFIQGEYGITVVPADDREDAPPVVGETLAGEQLALADLVGEPVVLNVWGSWCGPCVEEADDLVAAERKLGDVVFVGLNIRDNEDAARAFERAHDITWPSILDFDGSQLLGFRDTDLAAPYSPPTTYVIDAEGRLGARIAIDDLTATTLVDVVEEVRGG